MLVYIQNHRGEIVSEATFNNTREMLEAIEILAKPSMFGNSNFRIIIQG